MMNIAEKVLQLKQDFDDVYAAGQASSGGNGDYEQGFEDGKNSVVDYMKYAQAIKFKNLNLFGKSAVELNFDELTDLTEMFWAYHTDEQWVKNTTVEHITINTKKKVKSLYRVFQNSSTSNADTTLKHITFNFELDLDWANGVNINNAFQNAKGIEVIDGTPLNVSTVKTFNSTFVQCISLREIRFVENTIKSSISFTQSDKLSTDTIQSIFEGLATVDTAQTLTLHSYLKILQSQVDVANAKGWTVAGGIVVSEEEYYG